jgi:hypothetical protein
MAINFSTGNQTFRQLFGNGLLYKVPRFQRDYTWDADHWDDLWQDIQNVLSPLGDSSHYMGYLVLRTEDSRNFEVIDGQQRLTTLSLIALAVLKALQELVDANIDPENNTLRINQLRNSYIGYLDPVTLIPRPKLTLNRNNDAYYRDFIIPLLRLPQRGLRASEHLLRKSFEWFSARVRENYASEQDGETLARFLDELSDRLFFTVMTVQNDLNAFLVFETLNARGVRLSPTDLLKNHFFSVVDRESKHQDEIDTLERRWEKMVATLGGESFPNFLRAHWNSRKTFVREADLFKVIRAGTRDKAAVFDLIRAMEQDVDVYAGLTNPDLEIWNRAQRHLVRQLKMFNVRQPWPLLMAAYRAFDEAGFTEVLSACSIISFRYNVIGALAGSEQERVYNAVAQRTAEGAYARAGHLIRELRPIYISDERFKSSFAEKTLQTTLPRNKNVVRYILFELERAVSGTAYDDEDAQYTIEHVFPENPGGNWPEFTDKEADECLYRIGNMTILEKELNRKLGSSGPGEKFTAFARSQFDLTKRIAQENDVWTPSRIAARQEWMATQAALLWRIPRFYE